MGLDMYLNARVNAYKPYGGEKNRTRDVLAQAATDVGLPESANIDFISIERECAYWRKANAIHGWFVRECQDGVDKCQRTQVERDQLEALRNLCKQVMDGCKLVDGEVTNGYTFQGDVKVPIIEQGKTIANPEFAAGLLPTGSGFFFGCTDYDEGYYADLVDTVEQLDKALAMPENVEFFYQASW